MGSGARLDVSSFLKVSFSSGSGGGLGSTFERLYEGKGILAVSALQLSPWAGGGLLLEYSLLMSPLSRARQLLSSS